MIIDDLDIDRTRRPARPFEADAPLIIDPDAVLSLPITLQSLKVIPRQSRKVSHRSRRFKLIQFQLSLAREARESLDLPASGRGTVRLGDSLELVTLDWPLIQADHVRVLGRPLIAAQVTAIETNPMRDDLPTQRIARWSNRLRDERMLQQLLEALAAHRRVFASVGVTHAVMLEPALRAGVEPRPA